MEKYITGIYKKSIFQSNKGYVIGLFKVKETNDEEMSIYLNKTVTFTGYFTDLKSDDNYKLYGHLIENPKYGYQYQVEQYERLKPNDIEGIVQFLSSDLFKGIGEKLARKIVDTLGKDCLDNILEDKTCLLLVPKLTNKKMETIYNTLYTYEESHNTIVYLTEIGFTMQESLEIYNCFKKNTVNIVKTNIYKILDKIESISFTKIDQIAQNIDEFIDDNERIKYCIIYIMKTEIYKNGDTYLTFDDIYLKTTKYLNQEIDINLFNSYLKELTNEYKIVTDYEKYYLKDIFSNELEIIKKIQILNKTKVGQNPKIENYIENLEKSLDIKYNDKQKEAIIKSLTHNMTIITGGPGTGKTTIIKAITNLYIDINKLRPDEIQNEIALLAPTGRASKRLTESTNLSSSTIHRFLKWNKETNEFAVNEFDKAYHKLIIIDEVSMIDINLLGSLFKGLTDNIKLILVGDENQLPSVGPGQVLKDLINSETIETIKLELLYRQKDDSYINILAEEIRTNNLNQNFTDTKSDYTFLECKSESIKTNLYNLALTIKNKGYNYKKIQVMAPMYAGITGIDSLNKTLQEVFNPYNKTKKQIEYGDIIYRENDKILQLVNMPDENVYNGDIGVIKEIILPSKSSSGKNEIYVEIGRAHV